MAIKLSEVRGKITRVKIEWDGEEAEIGFYPARLTPALIEEVGEASKRQNLDVLGTMMEPVLAYWEVQDDEGKNYPTDAETIKTFPLGFLTAVMGAIQDTMRPPGSRA